VSTAELSAPLLGLPLLLVALLLLALWIAVSSRAASNWSSLFGGVAAVATVWLFATVALDRVWDLLWLPKDALGAWPSQPNALATVIALVAGAWLERRLRSQELGPVLTGVLDGCAPRNLYEWAASIGFLVFAGALVFMFMGPDDIMVDLSASAIWLGIAGAVATGGGLLAGGMSQWRTSGLSTRVVLLGLAGLVWCLSMDGLGRRLQVETRDAVQGYEEYRESLSTTFDYLLAREDVTQEERARWTLQRAQWTFVVTGVTEEYEDESGNTVLFEPDEELQAAMRQQILMPAVLREFQDDARTFRSLWPYVALAGAALGLLRPLRPLRAAPRAADG